MNDTTTATVRTALPMGWTAFGLWAATKAFDVELAADDLPYVLFAVPVVGGVVYRAAREVEARWPRLGRILLGSTKTPTYKES